MQFETPSTEMLDRLLFAGTKAARLGGAMLESWRSRFTVTEKSRANLVTEADFASQKLIHEVLLAEFPEHNFLGEEDLVTKPTASPYQWVVDPLDGTSNYVHGFPYYAVSIGLEFDGELIVGVIYDPTRHDLFTAVKGQGAFLNGQRLHCSRVTQVADAMCIASLPTATSASEPAVQRFLCMIGKSQTVQRTGSAALNLAYLAAGRIEAFWSSSLKPWDMAAGVLLVREAGGTVTKLGGQPFDLYHPEILASGTDMLQQEIIETFSRLPD